MARRFGLLALGAALTGICSGIRICSRSFTEETPGRPILPTVGLLAAATLVYLVALGILFRVRARPDRWALPIILGYALLFRLLLLPSTPILEIDFYRYLWDGRVTLNGFNPYRYSPFQVEDIDSLDAPPADLADLSRLAHESEAVREIFGRVHYRDVPTVYPPAAQVVFAAAAWRTPTDAPLARHILILKAVLVVFDLATLVVLVLLLRILHLPTAWCLAYGWCPLVLKEVANSGHLDSVAVFCTVLAIFLFVAATRPERTRGTVWLLALAGSMALAFGVLAKTYPLLLVPVVGAFVFGRFRRQALVLLAVFITTIVAGYLPFREPAATASADLAAPHHAGSGLGTFLTQWEMNDCLFMVVYHNLRRSGAEPAHWFVLVPGSWRSALHDCLLDPLHRLAGLSPRVNPAFLMSQFLLGFLLLGLCLRWAWQVYREPEPTVLLRAVFRTLAWGWLLASAQNPWYLLWCLPFLVFDGRLAWFLLPGAALLYYLRFWIDERLGTPDAFDFGLVWLEFGPFLLLLAVESWRRSSGWQTVTVPLPLAVAAGPEVG